MRSFVDRNVVMRRMTELNGRLGGIQGQSGNNGEEINIVSLSGSKYCFRFCNPYPSHFSHWDIPAPNTSANGSGRLVHRRFTTKEEIWDSHRSVEEDTVIPRTTQYKCKLKIRLFETSLFTGFKVDSNFAYWIDNSKFNILDPCSLVRVTAACWYFVASAFVFTVR